MSIERALILRAQPHMLRQRIDEALRVEVAKGCSHDIAASPVPIEPPYVPVGDLAGAVAVPSSQQADAVGAPKKLTRFRVWISPEERFQWDRSEMFLKQLDTVSNRVIFQIAGNNDAIEVGFVCHTEDAPMVAVAFQAWFQFCEITVAERDLISAFDARVWSQAQFCDFLPLPPYSHKFTTYDELHTSPFEAMLTAIHNVARSSLAFYQCVFEPVKPDHNWHENVATLLDIEYVLKLQSNPAGALRAMQQAPSGDLRQMARDVEVKAHNDKPFFAVAVRVGVVGSEDEEDRLVRVLASPLNVIQHGGRPLRYVSNHDYLARLPTSCVSDMICNGQTYRHGFLANSKELAGFVHVFPACVLEPRGVPVQTLRTLPLKSDKLAIGTRIGVSQYAGKQAWVCISPRDRHHGVHIVSIPGQGKTTLMQCMCLQDMDDGIGTMFIDSHGYGIRDLMACIKPTHRQKVIYFNPGDPERVPLWNPLRLPPGGDLYRLADDIVAAIKRISEGWGDRLEHIMRCAVIGVMHLPSPCFMDLYNLLRRDSEESKLLRNRIVDTVPDEVVRNFFREDYLKEYVKTDLQSPKHKLSKLVSAGSLSLMLSQPESLIDIPSAMDEAQHMFVDLSDLGADNRDIFGAFTVTEVLMAALARSKRLSEELKPFAVYIDDAYQYMSAKAIEDIIAQARKFRVHLCLAHQYLRQFETSRVDALTSMGSTIIGRVDKSDSHFFANTLQGKVQPEELMALECHEMIARIGSEIVRIKTQKLPAAEGFGRDIIEESRQRYYRRAAEVRQTIARRHSRLTESFAPLDPERASFSEHELDFDEW